jgi:predicted DCC family thiol-disulfide oxidoreductase YuxK
MASTPRATVIYDADCGFCKWCLALLLRWDGRRGALRSLPLGTGEADRLLADLDVARRQASWHLVLGGERSAAGAAPGAPRRRGAGAALAPALRLLRGGRAPAALFARFPRATEAGYRFVAGHRGLLGRFVPGRARRWADGVIAAHSGSPQ